jgi:hypothetical protein
MKPKLFITALIVTTLFGNPSFAKGQNQSLELKSQGLAVVLGLDPVPADALFYAGKPVQGTINALIGTPGAVLFWYGLIKELTHKDKPDTCADLSCSDWSSLAYAVAIGGGAVLYLPALIWDAIGGINGVKKHNEEVRRHASILTRVRPTLAVTNEGVFAGARWAF